MNHAPVAWTIAGSDSSAGAGIQADIKTMQGLAVYCASVITSVTAQNSQRVFDVNHLSADFVRAQIFALQNEMAPASAKIGMLGAASIVEAVVEALNSSRFPIVYDPVMVATSGDALIDANAVELIRSNLVPAVSLVTPNWAEAHVLAQREIIDPKVLDENCLDEYIEHLAADIVSHGARAVLLKGGHLQGPFAQDFWTDGVNRAWLISNRQSVKAAHGTGCTLSSAIAAGLAKGLELLDAIVQAKAYVNQSLRLAPNIGFDNGPLAHCVAQFEERDLPWLTHSAMAGRVRPQFERDYSIGFYPVVPDSNWVARVASAGAKTVQLRVKERPIAEVENEVIAAVEIARRFGCNLYVNDFWQLAIKHNAYGVHLGQEDILDADLNAVFEAGLRLGVSTHCYSEIARALAAQPSYIAIGPIFPTTTKVMKFEAQGIAGLSQWSSMLSYPLVAIGGITLESAETALQAGAAGVAVVRDVVGSQDPVHRVEQWMRFFESEK